MDPERLSSLKKKIDRVSEYKETLYYYPGERINFHNKHRKLTKETKIFELIKELEFLKKLLRLIENGATGFELAFELEKYHKIKKLIYNGIMFYNTFSEIGEKVFLEAPDKKEKDYHIFKTVENTEKYLFMVWLRDYIPNKEKYLKNNVDNSTLLQVKNKFIAEMKYCSKCGAERRDENQDICESCGEEVRFEW